MSASTKSSSSNPPPPTPFLPCNPSSCRVVRWTLSFWVGIICQDSFQLGCPWTSSVLALPNDRHHYLLGITFYLNFGLRTVCEGDLRNKEKKKNHHLMQKCLIQKPERLKLNTLYSVLIKEVGGVNNGSLTVIVIAVGNKTIFNKKNIFIVIFHTLRLFKLKVLISFSK